MTEALDKKFVPAERPIPSRPRPDRPWNDKYDAILDLKVANPAIKQGDIAKQVGMSQPWVCQVMNSDDFKVRYAERRKEVEEIANAQIADSVTEARQIAVEKVIQVLRDKGVDDRKFLFEVMADLLDRTPGLEKGTRNSQDITVRQSPAEAAWLARRAKLEEPVEAEYTEVEEHEG